MNFYNTSFGKQIISENGFEKFGILNAVYDLIYGMEEQKIVYDKHLIKDLVLGLEYSSRDRGLIKDLLRIEKEEKHGLECFEAFDDNSLLDIEDVLDNLLQAGYLLITEEEIHFSDDLSYVEEYLVINKDKIK